MECSENELRSIWVSKRCLVLKPNDTFQTNKQQNRHKLRWFYWLVKEDVNTLISSAIIGLILAGLGMATAVFSQKLIDSIIPSGSTSNLVTATMLLFFILVSRGVLQFVRGRMVIGQGMSFNNRIVNYFYSTLLLLPKRFFDNREIGDMTARLNDTARIQNTITQLVGTFLIDLLMLFVTFIAIFYYSWQIGVVAALFAPLYFIVVWVHNEKIVSNQREVMKSYAQTESFYIDTIKGIGVVKSACGEKHFSSIGSAIYGAYQHKVFSLGAISLSLTFLYGTIGVIFTTSVLTLGGILVINSTLTIGVLMALFALVSALIPSVQSLALLPIPLSAARIAFDRMFEFTGISSEARSKECIEFFESLSLENVTFRFQGRSALLKGISLNLKRGEVIALTGESGCGKSTIAQIIEKFYPIESGNILVNDSIPLQDIDVSSWRGMVGYVPQNPHIFNGTILENILLNSALQPVVLFEQIKEWGLLDFFNQFPMGLNTLIGERGINISGGQVQVIALLRALVTHPQLLILDEATSAMDRNTESLIVGLLNQLKSQIAIIIISHKMQIIKSLPDRIYILERGQISCFGAHEELVVSENFYSRYWADVMN